jgi:hypothetical protein
MADRRALCRSHRELLKVKSCDERGRNCIRKEVTTYYVRGTHPGTRFRTFLSSRLLFKNAEVKMYTNVSVQLFYVGVEPGLSR